MNNATTRNATATTTAQSTYEAKVIGEALKRVKGNPQVKGTIHELLFRDSINANPLRLLKGESASLVSNTTAKTVDLVVMKGGKVLERIQLKDTPASSSIQELITKINSGQYNSAQLKLTPETLEELGKHIDKVKGAKTASSSGISSGYTEQLGRRAGAPAHPGSTVVTKGLGKVCGNAAKSGAAFGGAAGAGIAAVTGAVDLYNGTKSTGEVAVDVAKGGTVGAASGAAASAAATATGALAGTAIASGVAAIGLTGAAATFAVVAAPVAVAVGVGYVVSGVCSSIWDSIFD
jgi:hypothetical protein